MPTHQTSPAEDDAGVRVATERVRRFLDAREGSLPIDVLAVVTRTGDRLLASDLRTLLEALTRVGALADFPPGDCEGHPCIWPEDIVTALSEPEATQARCACPPQTWTCPDCEGEFPAPRVVRDV